ncbi:MAG: VIT1/CCC1 transporter family protein [Promethearchaeota archaeon]
MDKDINEFENYNAQNSQISKSKKSFSKAIKDKLELWKIYFQMTDLGEIARRYFVMNFFDGILTVLGLVIGNFFLFLNGVELSKNEILLPALSISVAIGISGITGGYLAEKAERKKTIIDLKKSMALQQILPFKVRMRLNVKSALKPTKSQVEELIRAPYYPKKELPEDSSSYLNDMELEEMNVDPEAPEPTHDKAAHENKNKNNAKINDKINAKINDKEKEKDKDKDKDKDKNNKDTEDSLHEKAQLFATYVASLINGFAPTLGGIISVFPLFFISVPNLWAYILCFITVFIVLVLLGIYLARISNDKFIKYSSLMVLAGFLTAFITMFLGV